MLAVVSKVSSQAYQKASLADDISNRAWHWCQQHCIKPLGHMLDNCWEASQVETLCGLASSRVPTLLLASPHRVSTCDASQQLSSM